MSATRAERGWSLRRRMVLTVTAAACFVFAVLGFLVYQAVASSASMQFDETLRQVALLVLQYSDHEYGEGEPVVPRASTADAAPVPFDVVYQIGTAEEPVLYASPGAPRALLGGAAPAGFSEMQTEGRAWRVYTHHSGASPLVVRVAEPTEYRQLLLTRTLRAVALPLAFSLVLLTVLIGVVTERAFRPVRRMAEDLATRGADLSAVDTASMPFETRALGVALNGLLARHADVLARERRFTADAAHELRTPLAALRAQAQVAVRARTRTDATQALGKLQANIDRTAHLINQLLALARLEPGAADTDLQSTAASAVVGLVSSDLAAAIEAKGVALEASVTDCVLPGPAEIHYLLLRNLLENAIRHARAGGRVTLAVAPVGASVLVRVADDGPGIPAEERGRVFERFYRVPGGGSAGSGLGLSIVGRIVELLHGEIELGDPPVGTGLVVTVRLPRPDASAAAEPGAPADSAPIRPIEPEETPARRSA